MSGSVSNRQEHVAKRWIRRAFWIWLVGLSIMLLWPGVQIRGPIPRPDLVVHFSTFGLLGCLGLCARFGSLTLMPYALVVFLAGSAFGGLAEALQGIPVLARTAAVDDAIANAGGVLIGCIVGIVIESRAGRDFSQGKARQ